MQITGSTALVTGANRGLGAQFAQQLLERGARRVYATARRPESVTLPGVEVLGLDVTDPEQVAAAARLADDVDLVVNNAGVNSGATLVTGDLADIRHDMAVNLFGPLLMARAFAPVLAANGGGAILNVLSGASWFVAPGNTSYGVSKAAAWGLNDGLRIELAGQGTQVTSVLMGVVDTDMAAGYPGEKASPRDVVDRALDGLEAGASEVLGDDLVGAAKASLVMDPAERYAKFLGV